MTVNEPVEVQVPPVVSCPENVRDKVLPVNCPENVPVPLLSNSPSTKKSNVRFPLTAPALSIVPVKAMVSVNVKPNTTALRLPVPEIEEPDCEKLIVIENGTFDTLKSGSWQFVVVI